MKIILADDEQMIRLSLISMIEDIEGPCNTILQARNGCELVDMVKKEEPNVAFIDIKMPLLNGLDALKEVKKISPQTLCIMLTGYAEFQYAQSAVSYGAFEYLLKPVSLSALRDVFERIHSKLIEYWKLRNAQLTKEVYENYILNIEQFSSEYDLYCYQGSFGTVVAYSGIGSEESTLNDELNLFHRILKRECSSSYAVFRPFPDVLDCIIVELSSQNTQDAFLKLQTNLRNAGFCVFSLIHSSLEDANRFVQSTEEKAILRLLYSRSALTLSELSGSEKNRLFCKSLYETIQAIQQKNRFLFEGWIARLEIAETSDLDGTLGALKLHFPILQKVESIQDIPAFLRQTGNHLFFGTNGSTPTLADAVKDYIDCNYHHDIGTAVIADTFNITPNYLSGIFKKTFNTGLVVYLTSIRMKKAKQILSKNPSIPINQLASAVGYSSPSYFTKVFQKTYGMLPSEYR